MKSRHSFIPTIPDCLILLFISLLLNACSSLPETTPRPADWAKPIPSQAVPNFYRVTDNLYRSAQPARPGMEELQRRGIKTVLNLRYTQTDRKLADGTGLRLEYFPMLPQAISKDELIEAVSLLRNTPGPILVHCRHGADRTGAVIAAWRILEQGWPSDKAVDEMLHGGYGHHYLLFPNIRETLLQLQPVSLTPSRQP